MDAATLLRAEAMLRMIYSPADFRDGADRQMSQT